jgi:hypothetical protein
VALNALPTVLFIAGALGFFPLVSWAGSRDLLLSPALAYIGLTLLCTVALPVIIARLCGRKFYDEYFQLNELHSGLNQRRTFIVVTSVGGGFLIAAAAVYLFERLR